MKRTAKLAKSEKQLERKLHLFLDAWKEHVRDEIRIHAKLLRGRQSLSGHVRETIRIHRKFLLKMEKLV